MQWSVRSETPSEAILRYVDDNLWEWRAVVKVMNRTYHTDYTIPQLKEMYAAAKSHGTLFPDEETSSYT